MYRKLPPKLRLASNRQLWTLNAAGRLAAVEAAEPINAEQARKLVAELKRRESEPEKSSGDTRDE